ncbi:MAG: class I SAM-dependent methyltransferase, partial [Pseudomonadota bacterium]
LDVGCGAGASTRALAAAGTEVTGVDISPDLIALASSRGGSFRLGDAATMTFEAPFDAIFSRFGAMFFAEPVAAWTHLRTQTVRGARLVIVCFRDAAGSEWATLPRAALRPVLGDLPAAEDGAPGPFIWSDPARFRAILGDAGWQDIAWRPLEMDVALSDEGAEDPVADALGAMATAGPLGRLLGEAGEKAGAAKAAVAEALAAKLHEGRVRIGIRAWIITARAP